jgi:ankyrin repeat protein
MRIRTVGSILLLCVLLAGGIAAQGGSSEIADAAQRGDQAAVQRLISQGANVNAPQVDGATALHWAIYREDIALADLLIGAGASVSAANRAGATPLEMASIVGNPTLIARLIRGGADATQLGPNGETMLMFAARSGNPEAIKILVEAGAEVNARERLRGTTALMWAAEQRHPDAVRALLAAGADPAARSGGAGLPRNYMANRVNTRVVTQAQARRKRAAEAGRTYEEQLAWEQTQGLDIGGQRGLGQALGPDGLPLPRQPARPPHRRAPPRQRHRRLDRVAPRVQAVAGRVPDPAPPRGTRRRPTPALTTARSSWPAWWVAAAVASRRSSSPRGKATSNRPRRSSRVAPM